MPALVLADAVCRMLPDVLSDNVCFEERKPLQIFWSIRNIHARQISEGRKCLLYCCLDIMQTFNAGGEEQSLFRTAKYRPDLIGKGEAIRFFDR